ncbi:MAG: Holliday junction resolvase RuvX [Limisphaerales bacterium]|jgi:putative Holliday junction resolvase|nr:Holliday junction resolvase RuvX [Verrucomicrobiota bacterium]
MSHRILSLDHGTVRIGVAISDDMLMIAQPEPFVPADPPEAIETYIHQRWEGQLKLILVGMPRNMDGSYGPAAEKVKAFVQRLQEKTDVPIRTWDERLTSAQANRVMIEADVRRDKRKQKVDSMSAAILLQSYLDAGLG